MRIMTWILSIFCLIIVFSSIYTPARAADATVSTCDLASFTTAMGIVNAGAGGTITFTCSTGIPITFTSEFIITTDVIINANGNTVIFDEAGDDNRFFTVNMGASLTLNGLTLRNGNGADGGAIFNRGTLTISYSTLSGNSASLFGGAIDNNSATGIVTISNSTLSGNSAVYGGAILSTGTLTITDSTLSGNSVTDYGGAIYNNGASAISNSTFTGNSASLEGGAILSSGTLTITDSTLSGNSVTDYGGAIYNNGPVTISNSILSGNSATFGGAIFNNGGVTISNSILSGNSASNFGGAIYSLNPTLNSQATYYENNTCASIVPITDLGGNTRINSDGCPGEIVTTPPTTSPAPSVTVLGCALDSTDGVEVAGAPDNTYCRILMKNGGVISYSGAIPADLISLGVVLAVDVYRLEGGMSQNTFPDYARICLSGVGRYFYMDSRNAPRFSVEMPTEQVDGLTCAWIPAPGTVILTN